jgi:cysteine-rich CPCC protein
MDVEALISTIDALIPFYETMPGNYEGWLLHHRETLAGGSERERQAALRWIRTGLRSVGPSRSVEVRNELRKQPKVASLLDRLEVLASVDLFACPCCGYLTNPEPEQSFSVCPVCRWEDDGTTEPGEKSGANKISLEEGRANFVRFGASTPIKAQWVRPPLDDEDPHGVSRPYL